MQDYCTLALTAIFVAMSCTNQAVMEENAGPVNLNLDFGSDLAACMNSEDKTVRTSDDGKSYDLRYTVEVYRDLEEDVREDSPCKRFVFTKTDIEELDHQITMNIEDGDYEFYVWTDFVEKGTAADYFYNTESLRKIALLGKHKGNNDFRDAFFGHEKMKVRHGGAGEDVVSCTVGMERALAKCEFVTTDLKEFFGQLSGDIDYGNCKVMFYYTGRMPSVFDAVYDKPCATRTGVEFSSPLSVDDAHDTSLGFDYVFTGEDESEISFLVGLFDENGCLLSTTTHMSVPVKRNSVTKVDCQFIVPVTL